MVAMPWMVVLTDGFHECLSQPLHMSVLALRLSWRADWWISLLTRSASDHITWQERFRNDHAPIWHVVSDCLRIGHDSMP